VLEEAAYTVGDGSGKPLGIANAGSGITTVTAATGSTTSFKLANIKAAYKALPAAYRPFASWLFNPDDFAELATLADSAGGLVFPTLQNDPPTLLGRPVLLHPDLPTPAANARSAAFGDFKTGYAVRRVNAIGMTRLDELHSDSGSIGYRAYTRVDGRVLIADAIRILVHSAT
jgi:HK97 family phage major capsid protein